MNASPCPTALALLTKMFDAETRFLQSGGESLGLLEEAFHPAVVIHEPASLPYAGDWHGLAGVAELFRRMSEAWSDIRLGTMSALRDGNLVLMSSRIELVARSSGVEIRQPFAEALRFEDGRLIEGTPFYHDTAALASALG